MSLYEISLHDEDGEDGRNIFQFPSVKISTSVPGIFIELEPAFEIEASLELSVSFKMKHTYGFTIESSNKKIEFINDTSEDVAGVEIEIEGSVTIKFVLNPKITALSDKIANVGFEASLGLEFALKPINTAVVGIDAPVIKFASSNDSVHACTECINGEINFIIEVKATAKIFGEKLNVDLGPSISVNICPFHISNQCKAKLGECNNKKYKVQFNVTDNDGYALSGYDVTLNGVSGSNVFYCDNGTYNYEIKYSGKSHTGRVTVDNSTKTINAFVLFSEDKEGNKNPIGINSEKKTSDKITTTTVKLTTAARTTTTFAIASEYRQIAGGKLGDTVVYQVYADGTMYIRGYGDMYESPDLDGLNGVKKEIKKVVFDPCEIDTFDENGNVVVSNVEPKNLFFTSIGNSLFKGCSNLTEITIPETVTAIGSYVFSGCKNIPFGDYIIHDGVKSIGSRAFEQCYQMTSCTVPESVEIMGIGLFNRCLNLKSVTLPYAGETREDTRKSLTELLFDINGIREYNDGDGGVFDFEFDDN